MGPIGNGVETTGTFTVPVLDNEPIDPWQQRGYLAAPKMTKFASRSFPLTDFRSDVFGSETEGDVDKKSADFLAKYGFTAVKHRSALLTEPTYSNEDFDNGHNLEKTYYPEIVDLVKKVTGAKHVFATNSTIRKSAEDQSNAGQKTSDPAQSKANNDTQDNEKKDAPKFSTSFTETSDYRKPLHASGAKATRVPHMDYTPLGARQVIRSWRPDINAIAVENGIIAAEDKICSNASYAASDPESDEVIAKEYNKAGNIGPRYAAFSIWRPLKTVGRDPLAMAPRWESPTTSGDNDTDLVYWPYMIRVPGHPELGGDFCRELAMLRVREEPDSGKTDSRIQTINVPLQWYYLSDQQPDEVLFIKFFDSAASGSGGEADAPWHASPDLGDERVGEGRESIEVRVVAFW